MRHPPDPVGVVQAIRGNDPDVMERDELAEQLRRITELRAWCDAQQNRVVRRQRELAAAGRAEAPADLLAKNGGQSGRDARTADERERVCTTLPTFDDALAAGTVSSGHVDAIVIATKGLDAAAQAEFFGHVDALLADAERQSVDVFERNCRDLARLAATTTSAGDADVDELERQRKSSRVKRWVDRETGMHHTHIALDPVRDAQLWSAIDAARRSLRRTAGVGVEAWDQLQVDAVLAAVGGGDCAATGGVMVLIDLDTLQHGLHERGVCELADGTRLPVATVRHMACDAEIIPVVLDGAGRAIDVGRSARLATESQRHALRAMYRTCGYPGCSVPFEQCEMHHVEPFEQGGPTDLANLLPLCLAGGHHHQVHEGGWTLTMTPDRVVSLLRPDGTNYFTGSTVNRAPTGVGVA